MICDTGFAVLVATDQRTADTGLQHVSKADFALAISRWWSEIVVMALSAVESLAMDDDRGV